MLGFRFKLNLVYLQKTFHLFMLNKLLYCFLIFPIGLFAQNDTQIKGKVVSSSTSLEGIHVFNTTQKTGTFTDSRGNFNLDARVTDTLQFSAVHLMTVQHIVLQSDFKDALIFVQMTTLISELDEITLTAYKNINAVSLGIVSKNQKSFTPAERKLAAAGTFKWYSPLLIPLGGMSVDGMINSISGRTSMLKKEVETENKELLQLKTLDYFERTYFSETLLIPEEYVDGFLFYSVENERYRAALNDKNKTRAAFVLSELAVEYLKLNEMIIEKSTKDEK